MDLAQLPAGIPPPGVVPNFKNPPSLAQPIIAVHAVFLSLAVLFVALRLYTKIFLTRLLRWDDCEYPTLA